MTLAEEVTFINKGAILKELDSLPRDTSLQLDVRNTRFLDYDIIEILDDFSEKARQRNIELQIISEKGITDNPKSLFHFFEKKRKSA
jgi:MFS superfamily sulfate permease-like transporter